MSGCFVSKMLLPLILGFVILAPAARADVALDIEESDLRVKLDTDASDNWYTLAISSLNKKPVSPEVFALENPPRLVVDVPGFPVKASRQAPVRSGHIAGLRIGVHPGKLRLVFDLKDSNIPSFSSSGESSGSAALVTFNFGGAPRQPVVPTQETPPDLKPPQVTPEVVGEPVVIPSPKIAVSASSSSSSVSASVVAEGDEPPVGLDKPLSPTQQQLLNQSEDLEPIHVDPKEPVEITPPVGIPPTSSAPELTPEVIKPANSSLSSAASVGSEAAQSTSSAPPVITGRSTVKGIYFKSTPEYGPSLVVSIDSLGKYSLAKKQENLFELVLENSQFAGPHLELPQFSPDTFDGLDVLVAEKRGGDVVLKIYTGDGVRLAPFRIKGELWIRIVK